MQYLKRESSEEALLSTPDFAKDTHKSFSKGIRCFSTMLRSTRCYDTDKWKYKKFSHKLISFNNFKS